MPSSTPTSAFNCNTPNFSFAPCVPCDYNPPRFPWAIFFTLIHPCPSSPEDHFSLMLSSHITSYLLWTGYWTKSGHELQMCWSASQEMASCTGYMHVLYIKAITAASQAKQMICKPDRVVTEGRRA